MLAQLPCLQNLTLKACPVAEQQSYQGSIISLLPQLQILDSQKVSDAAMQARQQTQSKSAKQEPAQRGALQPQEKLPLSDSIDKMDRGMQPAKQKTTHRNDRAADSARHDPLVSSGTDKAARIASKPVSKRKQREQVDDSDTADAKTGHGASHASSGAQQGKKAKQATSTGQAAAADRQANYVNAVAGQLGKKLPHGNVTAAGGLQTQKDSTREEGRTQQTLTMGKTSGQGAKTLGEQTMIAVDTAEKKPSKKLREKKGKASAPVLGTPQAQASRKAQHASQALASGREVGLPRSNLHHGCNKHPSVWCAGIESDHNHLMSQWKHMRLLALDQSEALNPWG